MNVIPDSYKTFVNNAISKLAKTYTWKSTYSSTFYTCGGLCSWATGNSFTVTATGSNY